jgi:hypothetical protein
MTNLDPHAHQPVDRDCFGVLRTPRNDRVCVQPYFRRRRCCPNPICFASCDRAAA